MIGRASCRGAVTIVNAIPTGIGSAMGIMLQLDAEVRLSQDDGSVRLEGTEEGTDLVRGCIEGVGKRAGMRDLSGIVTIRSDIPVSRGLKSSSAASNAVVLAASRALNIHMSDEEIIGLAIDESIKAGVTVTGAFDDASACFHGGAVITDNKARRILKRWHVQDPVTVLLHVPERRIRKEDVKNMDFSPVRSQVEEAIESALRGDYPRAMELNSKACSKILDVSEEVAEAARISGAIAAGISGTGPATAVLVRHEDRGRIMDILESFDGTIISAELNDTSAREVVPRRS
ncbi:MAG: shikimate kinase [Thermoplasmata archaeon]|nr:shikimate kinase [Thermoplasmata archaeon]